MAVATLFQREISLLSISSYLGFDPYGDNEDNKKNSHVKAMALLEHFEMIPQRNTPANCPECGGKLGTVTEKGRFGWRYVCKNHPTKKRINPLENTFLQNVRINGEMKADKIVLICFFWLDRMPLKVTMETLRLSPETAVYWYSFCRDVACAIAWHDYIPIGGAADVVEVDKKQLCKRKNNEGTSNKSRDVLVVSGISRTTKEVFAVPVRNRDSDTLLPLLQQCVDGNSFVCSDRSSDYVDCQQMFNGYGSVNRSTNFIHPPRGKEPLWMPAGRFNRECLDSRWKGPPPTPDQQPFRIHTQTIGTVWRNLKKLVNTSGSSEHREQYLGEYMYRKNILKNHLTEKQKFVRLMADIKRVYPGVGKKAMKKTYDEIQNCDCHECEPKAQGLST